MKKLLMIVIIMKIVMALNSIAVDKLTFKLISTKDFTAQNDRNENYRSSEYKASFEFKERLYLINGSSEGENAEYIVWKKNDKAVSTFPTSKYKTEDQVYLFSSLIFSRLSRLWIAPYKTATQDINPDGITKTGILFFSEDGKTLIKDLIINSKEAPYIIRKEFSDENPIDKGFSSEIFYCQRNFVSVYGDITYSFPSNLRIENVSFTNDGRYFMFSDRLTTYCYDTKTNELVSKGLGDFDYIAISKDKKWCAALEDNLARIHIFKLNKSTGYPDKKNWKHLSLFKDIPLTERKVLDKHSQFEKSYYNLKIRFDDKTNNIILTSDDKWESVLEIIDETN